MVKVLEKIKSFWEWRMNFVRIHPFYSAWAAFVKGIIIGGLIGISLVFRIRLGTDRGRNLNST